MLILIIAGFGLVSSVLLSLLISFVQQMQNQAPIEIMNARNLLGEMQEHQAVQNILS